jgi:hypothetical protein
MSDLEQLQKNLNYKVKAQEIGLASWKGSHGKPQKMFLPTKDYLLNNPSKIQDEIKKRNDMMEEYLAEQETPIYRYDEYGDVMTDIDGNPIKYKFHGIPPPELNLSPLEINFFDPKDRRMVHTDLTIEQQKNLLGDKNQLIEVTNNELDERIRQYNEDYEINKENINNIDRDVQNIQEEIEEIYKIPDYKNRKKIVKEKKRIISYLLRDKQARIQQNEDIKDIIQNTLNEKEDFKENMERITANIQNKLKENKQKVETYNKELNALNRGALDTTKQFNETDEQYFERLQRLGDVPFADSRSEEKALMREKEKLRENLKLIIRKNDVISQVVNFLYTNESSLMHDVNKFFSGFKNYFIKKFGENNEKINFNDIVKEISFYLKRSTNPNVLSGNVINPEELAETIKQKISSELIPYRRRQPATMEEGEEQESITEKLTPTYVTGSEVEAEEGEESEEEGEIEKPKINMTLLDEDKTLLLYIETDRTRHIYIKYTDININIPVRTSTNLQGKEIKIKKDLKPPNFFWSNKNVKNSFRLAPGIGVVDNIAAELEVPLPDILSFFNIARRVSITKQNILDILKKTGLKPTLEGFDILKSKFTDKGLPMIGWGIKNSQDLPEKVPFGSNILFLKKLFLKNILSIQNKHNTKINGFNNVHVSDNFVKIIMNLLKNVMFTHDELNKLTNGERILLDNLLTLSELNKKFVTGSNTNSLNQLKKEYEILIGEIEAGNNNELLKKKLYNTLMKFVHFGALSQIQARKQYKEIVNEYF